MQIVVIGGGPAGLEAARVAAPYASVTLISDETPGFWRPLESRVWLADAVAGERNLAAIQARAARALESWRERSAADLAALDVTVLTGRARLEVELTAGKARPDGPGAVVVDLAEGGSERLTPGAVIVAAGAVPALPPDLAADGERIFTAAGLSGLKSLPRTALVLGDGPVGFELCHIFSRLGTEVTWLVPEEAPRSRMIPEVDGYLTRLLERQGVHVAPAAPVRHLDRGGSGVRAATAGGERYGAEVALLTLARRPDLAALGLPHDRAEVDVYGQTRLRGVYLVGDALAPRTASVAMAQARAAALHAVRRSSEPADMDDIVQCFMHGPQVAKLGRLTTEGAAGSVTVALTDSLAAYVHDTPEGFLTLAWDHGGRVAGAVAVGPGAAEILTPLAVARRAGLRLDDLAAIYGPHPSLSELVALAARRAG